VHAVVRRLSRGASAFALVFSAAGYLVAGGPATPALACSITSHCYGIAAWYNAPPDNGSGGDLYLNCLYSGNPGTDFTDEELWQGTDNSTGLNYWVELGGTYGWPDGASRYWFWADNRPNGGGYHAHYPGGTLSLGTSYRVGVTWAGNNRWAVQGPSWSAVSTGNPFSGRAMETGAEITDNTAHAVGNIQDLYYLDTAGDLNAGWSGASIQPPSSDISSISWVGSGNSELSWSTGSCS
jgi:hypothetical protein